MAGLTKAQKEPGLLGEAVTNRGSLGSSILELMINRKAYSQVNAPFSDIVSFRMF